MDQLLSDAKHLVQRLNVQENIFDSVISETITLQRRLLTMKQYHDEVSRMNDLANHRPRSTLILGSLVENQKIQNLELENKELSISLAEHQSALELIMNKYREQVLVMMKSNSSQNSCHNNVCLETEVKMREKISEMANVMRQSALIDDSLASKEIEALRCLQVENENLRELLQISGKTYKTFFPALSNELFNSTNTSNLSLNKSNLFDNDILSGTPFLKNKDSGIFENEIEESSSNDDFLLKKSNKLYDFHNSLEQLDINHDSNFNMELRSHLEEEPTMNCFRAIITNIQPLDVTRDSSQDSTNNSEDTILNSNNLSDDVFSENQDNFNFLPKRKKQLKKSFKETLHSSDNPLAYLFAQTEKIELVKKENVELSNDTHYESDADSELTFIGDDIDAALSELDSIVDDSMFLEDEDNF